MHKYLLVVIGLLGMITTFSLVSAAEPAEDPLAPLKRPTPDEAAAVGLEVVRQGALQSEEFAKSIGLASSEEVREVVLGTQLKLVVLRVPLVKLKEYQQEDNPKELLVGTGKTIYPLLLGGKVRASLSIARSRDGKAWHLSEVGSSQDRPLLEYYRVLEQRTKARGVHAIEIPDMGLHFLGWVIKDSQGQETFYLTPIAEIETLALMPGRETKAQDIFARLAPIAKALHHPVLKKRGN